MLEIGRLVSAVKHGDYKIVMGKSLEGLRRFAWNLSALISGISTYRASLCFGSVIISVFLLVLALALLPHTRRLDTSLLPLLIRLREPVVQLLDPLDLGQPVLPLVLILNSIHQFCQAARREELVLPVI